MLVLERDRFAAVVAQHRRHGVHRAALRTRLLFGRVRVNPEDGPARPAIGAQMVKPFELSALALPISDRVLNEFQLRGFAKVGNRKHGPEDCLEPGVLAFRRKQIHLEEAVVRLTLDFNQVRNSDRCFDSRKIVPLSACAISSIR